MEELWWAAVHGVARSRTRLSDFTFTFHFHALEKEMATHSSVLAWRNPGTGEPGGLPSMGSQRVGHDWSDLAAAAAAQYYEANPTVTTAYNVFASCPFLLSVFLYFIALIYISNAALLRVGFILELFINKPVFPLDGKVFVAMNVESVFLEPPNLWKPSVAQFFYSLNIVFGSISFLHKTAQVLREQLDEFWPSCHSWVTASGWDTQHGQHP